MLARKVVLIEKKITRQICVKFRSRICSMLPMIIVYCVRIRVFATYTQQQTENANCQKIQQPNSIKVHNWQNCRTHSTYRTIFIVLAFSVNILHVTMGVAGFAQFRIFTLTKVTIHCDGLGRRKRIVFVIRHAI